MGIASQQALPCCCTGCSRTHVTNLLRKHTCKPNRHFSSWTAAVFTGLTPTRPPSLATTPSTATNPVSKGQESSTAQVWPEQAPTFFHPASQDIRNWRRPQHSLPAQARPVPSIGGWNTQPSYRPSSDSVGLHYPVSEGWWRARPPKTSFTAQARACPSGSACRNSFPTDS